MGKIKSIIKPSRENGNTVKRHNDLWFLKTHIHPETCFFCWIYDKNRQSADFHIHATMIQHWITNLEINNTYYLPYVKPDRHIFCKVVRKKNKRLSVNLK